MVRKRRAVQIRREAFGVLLLVGSVIWPAGVRGQEQFDYVRRKTQISLDIQQSLTPAKLGLELLQRATSEEEILRASAAIYASYKHLRAAQEASQNLEAHGKMRDPLIALRNARIQWIRDRLRFCRDNDEHLVSREPAVTETCIKGLVEAVRRLEIVVVTDQ